MKSVKSLVIVMVLVLGFAASAQAISVVGDRYDESFTGGTFDDTQSAFQCENPISGIPDPSAIDFNPANEAIVINNDDGGVYDGWLRATLDSPSAAGDEVAIETVISVSKGAWTLDHHAHIINPTESSGEAMGLTIKALDIDADTWQLNIWISDLVGDSINVGVLDKADLGTLNNYRITERILTGGLLAEVYIDDALMGTYPCNSARTNPTDVATVRVGNSHASFGFHNAYVSSVKVGTFVPEPVTMTLLAVGGLTLLRRRKK